MTVGFGRQDSPLSDPAAHPAAEALRAGLPADSVAETGIACGQAWALIARQRIVEALLLLRDHPALGYGFLADLAGVHTPARGEAPYEVVYQLASLAGNGRFRLKVRLAEDEECPSATGVFPGAEWMEREAFDLVGIRFANHPDLRRILNPQDFTGHPLRKDFPVRGRDVW
jgi:NADH-quinone oxidoreductase subunit C